MILSAKMICPRAQQILSALSLALIPEILSATQLVGANYSFGASRLSDIKGLKQF